MFFSDDDQTLAKIIDLASRCGEIYGEIFSESMYFITNMATTSSDSQFERCLLNKEIIVLIVRVLQHPKYSLRLLLNTVEALQRYLDYDRRMNLQEEASIKEYFMGLGGDLALNKLKRQENFELYEMVCSIIDKHFSDDDDSLGGQDFLFS